MGNLGLELEVGNLGCLHLHILRVKTGNTAVNSLELVRPKWYSHFHLKVSNGKTLVLFIK